jgi:short-subunit dehydrogenase
MGYALVTGGSKGIGYEIAAELARRDHDLILVARDTGDLKEAKQRLLSRHDVDVQTLSQDLSRPRSAKDLIRYCNRQDWEISLVVNNAGFGDHGDFLDADVETHQQMLILNCFTPVTLAHHYLDDGCDVINVASTAAYQPLPGFASYAATKWYVYAWSVALNQEVDEHVLTVCPGPTNTGFADRAGITGDMFENGDTPGMVAAQAIDAYDDERDVCITGWKNKVFAALSRMVPPSWLARLIR